MTKAERAEGKSIRITGQTTTVAVGSVYRRSGATTRSWIGVVTDEILGTSAALTTIDGRPVQIGDGVAAEAQYGDGKGDMFIEGVFTLRLPASGTLVLDGQPVYMQVPDFTDPTATTVASGVTPNGGYAASGILVGFAEGISYTASTGVNSGLRVVDVKLLGLPLHALASVAP